MGWSFRVARVAGIDIKIHVTFFLILLWVMYMHRDGGSSAMLNGVVFVLAVFLCVVLHELGHALAAKRYGVTTRDIILLPIGGVARLERIPDKPAQELVVAIAGPLVNVVIATVLISVLVLTGRWTPMIELGVADEHLLERLAIVNVFLVLFNLIPAFPMDGGRILRSLLAMRLPYARATRIAANLGQGLAFLFGFLGLLGNPFLLFIALFVWIGAAQESSMAQVRHGLAGVPVSDVMLTDFHMLDASDPLQKAVDLTLQGSQRDFPVVTASPTGLEPVGILTHGALIEALRSGGLQRTAGEVMVREFLVASPREMIQPVFDRLQAARIRTVPVLESGRLSGLLTLENVAEFLEFREALERV